ncbi:MAG TPA: transglutaminase family protein [Chitinophagaceae bacterium]|nr:transglutaminase family protein [Chitinophagaceae bacterium]MCB9054558.1 transglutaminase family protein [Chitinophagales bacterium]HPG11325.1 transglutaminase family protein [Chitinophagaceae bacterium]HRX92521.1 transglutaminase family protein [Chitinophagaceae bacterium]
MADYHIKHITRYTYASTVIDCTNQIMLYPISDNKQTVSKHEIKISGEPPVDVFQDYFGNKIGVFSIVKPHNSLTIESLMDVTITESEIPQDNEPAEEQWKQLYQSDEVIPYMDFLQVESFIAEEEIDEILTSIVDKEKTPFQNAQALSEYIYKNFEYKKGVTSIETKVDEILKLKAGVCQDFAHLMLLMLRIIRIPARYVSGYICPKNHELRGEGATHAWVEAFLPFYGWLGLDPTNNCIVSDRHVRLAVGRNFSDCTPVKGTYKGSSEHTLEVSVSIDNGHVRTQEEKETVPVFSYTSKNPGISNNSYRRYLEMQQQQQ